MYLISHLTHLLHILSTIFSKIDLLMSLAWMLIPFLPASNLMVVVGTLMAERLLYLPSVGFCMGLSILVHRYVKSKPVRGLFCLALLSAYGWRTYTRNFDWESDETLFISGVETCPNSAKMRQHKAQILMTQGKRKLIEDNENEEGLKLFEEGKAQMDIAREIYPDWCDLGYFYGSYYIDKFAISKGKWHMEKNVC